MEDGRLGRFAVKEETVSRAARVATLDPWGRLGA